MTEEDAFVAGIAADPLDDLRRLVYADWLDERGRAEESEYLRLVAALAAPGEAVDVTHPHAVRLLALADGIDHTWRTATGGRFDLWFHTLDSRQKIWFIRCVREVRGCGLLEAKEFTESLPTALATELRLEDATAKSNVFRGVSVCCEILPAMKGRSAWTSVRRWH